MNSETLDSTDAREIDVIADHFDRRAARYAEKYDSDRPRHIYEHEKRERVRWTLEWIDRFAAGRPFASCLDVGCGDGRLLRNVLAAHNRWTGTGIDISPEMIRVAGKQSAANESVRDRTVWNVESLTESQHTADVVVSLGVVGYQADQSTFLAELASRVLPGGLLIVSFANGRSVLRGARAAIQRVKRMAGRDKTGVQFDTLQLSSVDRQLRSQGLQRVELRWLCFGLGLPISDFEVRTSRWCERRCTIPRWAERLAQVALVCYQRES